MSASNESCRLVIVWTRFRRRSELIFHAVYDGYLETIISESLAARIYVEDKGTFALVGIRLRHFGQYEQHCNLLEPDAKMSYRLLVIIFGIFQSRNESIVVR